MMDRNELADRIARGVASFDEMRAAAEIIRQSAWRPMSEAPRDGTWVLIWPKDHVRPTFGCWFFAWDRWMLSGWTSEIDNIEEGAWQPLPPPPADEVVG